METKEKSTVTLTVNRPSISLEAALAAIEAGASKAREIGVPMTIAIVDESAILKAMTRMDGASLISVEVAVDKAYTAAASGFSTGPLHEFIKGDPPLAAGFPTLNRVVVFGGGVVIQDGEAIIGAVGVSGGHYSQDEVVAAAAVEALQS
jgi:uncharacterized protein GlcG (DUF336 family)